MLIVAFTASADEEDSGSEPVAYVSGIISLVAGALVLIWVIIMLVLRLLNIGLLNLGSKYFLSVVSAFS